jgi:hypothetical protein
MVIQCIIAQIRGYARLSVEESQSYIVYGGVHVTELRRLPFCAWPCQLQSVVSHFVSKLRDTFRKLSKQARYII